MFLKSYIDGYEASIPKYGYKLVLHLCHHVFQPSGAPFFDNQMSCHHLKMDKRNSSENKVHLKKITFMRVIIGHNIRNWLSSVFRKFLLLYVVSHRFLYNVKQTVSLWSKLIVRSSEEDNSNEAAKRLVGLTLF